jgi:hypothetical protein
MRERLKVLLDLFVPGPMTQAQITQILLISATFLVGDFGQTMNACLLASAGYWLCVMPVSARARRGLSPTRFERLFIRWGLLPLAIIAIATWDFAYYIRQ